MLNACACTMVMMICVCKYFYTCVLHQLSFILRSTSATDVQKGEHGHQGWLMQWRWFKEQDKNDEYDDDGSIEQGIVRDFMSMSICFNEDFVRI